MLPFPESLSERYRPKRVQDFVGLDGPKRAMFNFLQKPYQSAWLFVGESGTGKTTMGLALAEQLPAELIHIASRECDLDTVQEIARRCHYYPWRGKFYLILVDEADQMTHAAQLAFLSKLDATGFPPNAIFVFTANATDRLERRFLSRCRQLCFDKDTIGVKLASYLENIAEREGFTCPLDYGLLVERATGNVRDALMQLEVELLQMVS